MESEIINIHGQIGRIGEILNAREKKAGHSYSGAATDPDSAGIPAGGECAGAFQKN